MLLHDGQDARVAMALPLSKNLFVTSDQAWQNREVLFWKDQSIVVQARDFDRDLLFFQMPSWRGRVPHWSDQSIAVGSDLYWFDGWSHREVTVMALGADSKDWFVLEGDTENFIPGTPVFSASGEVMGIVLRQNKKDRTLEGVRSDRVLDIRQQMTTMP